MERRQIFHDILNEVYDDSLIPGEIQDRIQRHTGREYPLQEIKDELISMYALGLLEPETTYMASKKGCKLMEKLQKEEKAE